MIISLDKFKATGGSGGSGGGDVIINIQGLPFNEIGYDPNQQNDATNILMNDFQISKDAYMNWDSNRTDASYLFSDSEIEYGPAIDLSNVTNINGMYANCRNLKYVPEIDLTNITEATDLFAECISLNEVRLKGNVQENINCNNMFANIPATVYLNCSGNSNAIITQAQQYGNQIIEMVSLNVSKFKYFLPNTNTILQGILNPESNYAEVNGEKYPLRYFGNGDYKVILPNETTEAVVLYVENQNPHAISTGVDMGMLNQELMPAPEVLLDNFYNYFEKSEGVGFNNELEMYIPSGEYVIYKVEIPAYFNGRCSLYIDGSAEDGNISGIEIYFYDMYDNPGWMFTLGENTYWDELINEIYFDQTDYKSYIKFKIQNNTTANVWFTQPIVFGLKENLSGVEDTYDISKKILLFDNDENKLTTSYESLIAHMDGDIYNTEDTYYNYDADVLKYNDPVENYIDETQFVERYIIHVPKYKKDFKYLIDEFPYVRCTVYDYNGKYTVLQKRQSWPMDNLAINISSQIYQKTEGVTMESSVVTIPAHGKILFKRNAGKFFYSLTINDLEGNVLDPTVIYTMKFEEDPEGNIQYYTASYDGKQFFAGKYLYIENQQDYTVKVDITQNADCLGNASFIADFDHYDITVNLLDENNNWINDTYDIDNHPITWTWGELTGNMERTNNGDFRCRIPTEFYYRFYEGLNPIDVVLTLEDGTTYNVSGSTYMMININTQN